MRSKCGIQFRQWATRHLAEYLVKGFTMDGQATADGVLTFNGKDVLQGKGGVSNAEMEKIVDAVYEKFNARRKAQEALQADQEDINILKEFNNRVNKLQ